MSLIRLFLAFLQIGACSIGGGYATIPLIQDVVLENAWLSMQEFTDIITISQMTPGPLAVNTSTFVGMRLAGIPGAIVATVGCIFTGVLLSILLSSLFQKFASSAYVKHILLILRAVSTGLILSASVTIIQSAVFPASSFALFPCLVGIASFYVLRKYKVNSMYVLVVCGILGMIWYA